MNARAVIWDAVPRKPAVFLQYELTLRGKPITYRQARRIVATGEVPKSLWGDFWDVMDQAMSRRRAQIAEADRQIKLARDAIRHVVAQARMAGDDGQALQDVPLPLIRKE